MKPEDVVEIGLGIFEDAMAEEEHLSDIERAQYQATLARHAETIMRLMIDEPLKKEGA